MTDDETYPITEQEFMARWKEWIASELPKTIDLADDLCNCEYSVETLVKVWNGQDASPAVDDESIRTVEESYYDEFGDYYDSFLSEEEITVDPEEEGELRYACMEVFQDLIDERMTLDTGYLYRGIDTLFIPVPMQYEVTTDSVSLSRETVNEDEEEFQAFMEKVREYRIPEDVVSYVLDNACLSYGAVFIGGIFNGEEIVRAVLDSFDYIETESLVVGVINRFEGSGCYTTFQSDVPLRIVKGTNVIADYGPYSLWDIYGRDVEWSGR
jgi:hypothetical protein